MDKLSLWTDGGARGNPGPAAAGVVLRQGAEVVWQVGAYLGKMTNNQAEYRALLLGLKQAHHLGASTIAIYMDSQLVVEQVSARYKVKDAGLQERWAEVHTLLAPFRAWTIEYVPRAQNSEADALVNQALDAQVAA
jgi:ribonuclease HI